MQKLKFLNTKEIKEIRKKIEEQWGCDFISDNVFVLSSKNKIYLLSKDVEKINFKNMRISSAGLYFAEISENGELRLSIEGAQLIGRDATKNVVNLTTDQVKNWLRGNDLDINTGKNCFVILKHGSDFLGTGRAKQNKIINFIPKTRRILSDD
ncbi:MAG: hypothetical protein QXG86_01730 [Candidatus Woesearchaeota archaeon]